MTQRALPIWIGSDDLKAETKSCVQLHPGYSCHRMSSGGIDRYERRAVNHKRW